MKNWCFQIVVLEKTLDTPLDSKEIKPVNPKGNQPWIFTRRTDVEVEAPILDGKSWLTGKDPDAGKDWRQKEKGTTEDEMVGWHHRLDGHELEQTLGDGEGQGHLVCCCPRGCKESDMTEQQKAATLEVIWKDGSTRCLSVPTWGTVCWIFISGQICLGVFFSLQPKKKLAVEKWGKKFVYLALVFCGITSL